MRYRRSHKDLLAAGYHLLTGQRKAAPEQPAFDCSFIRRTVRGPRFLRRSIVGWLITCCKNSKNSEERGLSHLARPADAGFGEGGHSGVAGDRRLQDAKAEG